MIFKKTFKKFWRTLTHPRVIIFMLLGIGIIFLTFLTDNNALEIAISAMASVFIGIAVNNYSIIDTHESDKNELRPKIAHSVKMMEITMSKIKKIQAEINSHDHLEIQDELAELEQCMNLAIELIKEARLAG